MIIDDIHWSPEMSEAWNQIKLDTHFNCKIDLFHFGLLTSNENLTAPIDLSWTPFKYKPFEIGLFSKD